MCILYEQLDSDEYDGYKVVAKKDGKYYSIAMGFRYINNKKIPHIKKQRRLSDFFISDILESDTSGRSWEMVGRTAIFVSEDSALSVAMDIKEKSVEKGYEIKVMYAKVMGSLMRGHYGRDMVIAGKRLILEKEVEM